MPPEGLELMTQNQFYIMTQEGIEPWTSVTQTLPAYSNHSSMDGGVWVTDVTGKTGTLNACCCLS